MPSWRRSASRISRRSSPPPRPSRADAQAAARARRTGGDAERRRAGRPNRRHAARRATCSRRAAPTSTRAYYRRLQRLAKALNQVPGRVLVVGHTDDQPLRSLRYQDNFELSRERAVSVVKMLQAGRRQPGAVELDGRRVVRSRGIAPNPTRRTGRAIGGSKSSTLRGIMSEPCSAFPETRALV